MPNTMCRGPPSADESMLRSLPSAPDCVHFIADSVLSSPCSENPKNPGMSWSGQMLWGGGDLLATVEKKYVQTELRLNTGGECLLKVSVFLQSKGSRIWLRWFVDELLLNLSCGMREGLLRQTNKARAVQTDKRRESDGRVADCFMEFVDDLVVAVQSTVSRKTGRHINSDVELHDSWRSHRDPEFSSTDLWLLKSVTFYQRYGFHPSSKTPHGARGDGEELELYYVTRDREDVDREQSPSMLMRCAHLVCGDE